MGRLLKMIKSVLALCWVRSGLLRLVHRMQGPRILVLAYHRVTPDDALHRSAYPAMHVSCSSFEQQLLAVRELYRFIPLAELKAILNGQQPLTEPVAILTFDDGYKDNFEQAFPVLTELNIPATFFLSFGFVDRGEPFWFDHLADSVTAWDHQAKARSSLRDCLPDPLVAALDAPASMQARCRSASAFLKSLPEEKRLQAMQDLQDGLDLQSHAGNSLPMTWDEVRTMHQAGMSMGAHSVSHAILTTLREDKASDEISASMDGVSRRLGTAVDSFAYPNGDANQQLASLVERAGATVAFTMEPRQIRPGDAPLQLGRTNVCQDTSCSSFRSFSKSWFWCEITGFFDVVLRRNARRERSA